MTQELLLLVSEEQEHLSKDVEEVDIREQETLSKDAEEADIKGSSPGSIRRCKLHETQ